MKLITTDVVRVSPVSRLLRGLAGGIALLLLCLVPQDAHAAIIQQVQSGTTVNTANGTQTITISSVDMTKSFLVFQVRSSGNRPVNSMVRGRLASATTIEFERATNEGAPLAINIQWYVATFGSGVSVQRGSATMNATTVNVPITAVSSMSQAFVLWSIMPAAADVDVGPDDVVTGDLTTTSNLQFRIGDSTGSHLLYWQVVEFTNPADINVQRGSVATMTGAALTATATLPTAVDPTRTFVLAGFQAVASAVGTDIGARMIRAQLTGPTTVTFDRSISGSPDNLSEISYQVVELKDGSFVQSGNTNFASGTAQTVVNIGLPVNPTRSIAFSTVQENGLSMGRTPYALDDAPGVASFTAGLTSTTLTLDRNNTAAAADVVWTVIQFAGGNGFKVGSFAKAQGAAPASQTIAHGLGEIPKALILWTEAQPNASFSSTTGITFHGAATGSAPTGSTTLTVNVPSATAINDVMVASIGFRPDTVTITPPAGWVLVRRMNNAAGSGSGLAVYGKVATSTEPASYDWTFNTSTGLAGGIQSFAGVDLTNPFDVDAGATTGNALTHAAPSITTTSANDMIITSHEMSSGATWLPPAGMTEGFDVTSNAPPDALGITVEGNWVVQAAAGVTGTKTATASNDSDTGATHTMALRAAPATPGLFGFGMTDGTTSRSVGTSSQDAVGTSNASTRMAGKVLTLVRYGEVVVAEADLSSMDDTNFTLNWTTNDANAYIIHYIAIGGSDVQAKVVDWTMRTTTGTSAIAGVGFQPDVVFHAHGGYALTGSVATLTSTGITQAGGSFGLGVMDADGDQWAFANITADAAGTSATERGQQTNGAIYAFTTGGTVQKKASWVSMNADGFTVNFTNTGSAVASRVFSLALKGINVKPGSFLKSNGAAPATQAITGVGFTPNLVFLASTQNTTQAAPTAHARFGLGASDASTQSATARQDTDNISTMSVDAVDRTDKIFVKVNNNTPAVDAQADLASTDADGFTLNWTTNDAVQSEILYLTMAPLALTEARLTSFTATRDARGIHLAWKTGYEVNNLGFHLYREIDGRRTRVDASLIAGSGLTVGSRRVTGERSYAYWDVDRSASSPNVRYWLEDVDFSGRSTFHGPVSPAAPSAMDVPVDAQTENSESLSGLGRDGGRTTERFFASAGPGGPAAVNALRAGRLTLAARVAAGPDPRLTQWTIAGQPAVKIGVRLSGWYRVSQAALVAAGLDPSVDPSTLHLFLEGIEQPIVVNGSADGHFDPADSIEFYGTGIDTPASDTAVYWLTGGSGTGLRVPTVGIAPAAPVAPGRFFGTLEHKIRSLYFNGLRNGDAENWFGPVISSLADPDDPTIGQPLDVTVTVPHPDASAPSDAVLEVTLQGVTAVPETTVDHRVGVSVNGTLVGEVDFQGRDSGTATLTLAHSLLLDGANVIRLEALGGDQDVTLYDTIRLSYWHTNDADANQLALTADANQTVSIDGFTSGPARVVDVTDPQAVVELPTLPGASSVTVQTPGSTGTRSLLAFTEASILAPSSVVANQPSALHDAANAKNYLIITHPDFAAQVAPLAALRASQGFSAAVISIDDIYDEFNFGERSPDAVKDFLALARTTWAVAPKYVVLAGDATFDPRDYAGFGFADFVPTKLIDMAQIEQETASDDWFVDSNLDGLPELAIGRLPVRTAAQADTVVNKIIGYDADPGGTWSKNIAFVTDTDDPTSHFRASTSQLQSRVPDGYAQHRFDHNAVGADGVRAGLFDQVGQGQLIVNYLGHGSDGIWGSGGELLDNSDIGTNWAAPGAQLPLVLAMNCLNGFFQDIFTEGSLAEVLLRSNGGAVAVWASSTLTEAEPQGLMDDELFRLVFQQTEPTLGDAIVAAKRAVADIDVRRSWTFFGDPAMRLKGVPTVAPVLPTLTATPASVNFGVIVSGGTFTSATSSQTVLLAQAGAGAVTWVATADQPWIQIANGAGTGSGTFSISVAAGGLPPTGTASGTVTITATGAQTSPTVTVHVSVIAPGTSGAPFGAMDTPQQGVTGVSGALAVTGWALDDVEVKSVQIFRSAVAPETAGLVPIGQAFLVPGARPDVEAAFPQVPFNGRAGWGYMLLTNMLPNQGNGTFTLHAMATDAEGHQTLLASRTFTSDNAHATAPFGTIDTPNTQTIASGTQYVNSGWALAPQGKTINFDGSTISVYIDGVLVGHPGPLQARSDIQTLFPGYANTNNAVGAFVFDTTAYADGVHSIAWVVTDSDGVSAGIGSRYFVIVNGGGAHLAAAPAQAGTPGATTQSAAPVLARRGYDLTAPLEVVPDSGGTRRIVGYELERVEILLAADGAAAGSRYEGYLMVGGERRPLPIGSTLDAATGRFSWSPGAGFIGGYELLFVRTAADGQSEQLPVEVVLRPKHRNSSRIDMAIDQSGDVASSFVVSGWAIDRGARTGTGIDALSVWAYPNPGSGAAPVFLGIARSASARPDVGAYYGARFADSGYELRVDGLEPGAYTLAVFPHSTVTGQYEAAAVAQITVK